MRRLRLAGSASFRRRWRSFGVVLVVLASSVLVWGAAAGAGHTRAEAASDPLVLAMYYAWFDGKSWTPGTLSDMPIAPYLSADRGTVERQVREAQAAGLDGFTLNWWGPGNPTDQNLQTLLGVAAQTGFLVTLDYDMNSPFIRGPSDVVAHLNHASQYFSNPAWVRYGGKPVVMFFGIRAYDVATWAAIRAQVDPGHRAVWVGEGDIFSYLSVFDGIHPYSISWSADPAGQLASYAARTRSAGADKLWVATVMPGYDDTRLGRGAAGYARDRASGTYYAATWNGAIATRPAFVSITSWNEWPEGSQIEPSVSYGDAYLRLTKQFSDRFKAGASQPVTPGSGSAPPTVKTGRFYTEAGEGRGGYWISDEAGMGFNVALNALGGPSVLGYPCSERFQLADGFVYQATQGALLQGNPGNGRVVLANSFEILQQSGKDGWLDQAKGMPAAIADDGSNGNWTLARAARLAWLTNDAIRARYMATGSADRAIELYGLPMSKPEQRGPFVVQRFQRAAFQQWVENVPGMPRAGSVVWVLGGDLLKEAGLIPAAAVQPQLP